LNLNQQPLFIAALRQDRVDSGVRGSQSAFPCVQTTGTGDATKMAHANQTRSTAAQASSPTPDHRFNPSRQPRALSLVSTFSYFALQQRNALPSEPATC
jgi:hypothetical protein